MRPGVAIGRAEADGVTLLSREDIDPARTHDDTLLPAIHAAVLRAGGVPRDLVRIAVSAGPGGYTAVRLAITAAKMIAETTGAACIPVPTAAVVARRVRPGLAPFAVVLASKSDTAFAAMFADGATMVAPGRVIGPGDIRALGVRRIIADRFLPKSFRDAAAESSIAIELPTFDAAACLEAAAQISAVEPVSLVPIYPREPEAVTKWRALHPPEPGGGPRVPQ